MSPFEAHETPASGRLRKRKKSIPLGRKEEHVSLFFSLLHIEPGVSFGIFLGTLQRNEIDSNRCEGNNNG